jgi:probable addiction module antidote protein
MSDFDIDKIRQMPEFRVADYLDSPAMVAAYLNDILEDRDAGLLAFALGELAKARGMPVVAAHTGLAREALYKALRAGSSPRLDTILKVLDALGMRLVVVPR